MHKAYLGLLLSDLLYCRSNNNVAPIAAGKRGDRLSKTLFGYLFL